MIWRRYHPIAIPLAVIAASTAFPVLGLLSLWALMNLSAKRQWKFTVLGALLFIISSFIATSPTDSWELFINGQPIDEQALPWLLKDLVIAIGITLFTIALVAIGAYSGARKETVHALQERRQALEERNQALEERNQALADRLESAQREQTLIARTSRQKERTRIAREMHDVLAHKISLISIHAGALAYRGDLSVDQTRQAAQAIQSSAHEALTELRTILGQLRQVDNGRVAQPQPLVEELDTLIEEIRSGGCSIDFRNELEGTPSPTISRHAYRIMQECLTNAHKHAPNEPLTLTIGGSPDKGVQITASNPLGKHSNSPVSKNLNSQLGKTTDTTPSSEQDCVYEEATSSEQASGAQRASDDLPYSGLGLLGISERVELVSGTMRVTRSPQFTVEVNLPW